MLLLSCVLSPVKEFKYWELMLRVVIRADFYGCTGVTMEKPRTSF